MLECEELKRKIEGMVETVNSANMFHNKMEALHDEGLFKEDPEGNFIIVDDIEERRYLKEEISSKKRP